MSTDQTVATHLIHTLENGKEGFEKAAVMLTDSYRPDVAAKFSDEIADCRRHLVDWRHLRAIALRLQQGGARSGQEVDSTMPRRHGACCPRRRFLVNRAALPAALRSAPQPCKS